MRGLEIREIQKMKRKKARRKEAPLEILRPVIEKMKRKRKGREDRLIPASLVAR